MIITGRDGDRFNISVNPNKLEYCVCCEQPMFLIYYHPEKKIRIKCSPCGGHALVDSLETLKERRAEALMERKNAQIERLKTLRLDQVFR